MFITVDVLEVAVKRKGLISFVLLLAGTFTVAATAYADHHGGYYHGGSYYHHDHDDHNSYGVVIGVPFGFPGYYGGYGYPYPFGSFYPYYPLYPAYPAGIVAVPSGPITYIQRDSQPGSADQSAPSWYYCPDSKTYYPYVKECPGGWQRVAPHPTG
jgi:hypothetical protein